MVGAGKKTTGVISTQNLNGNTGSATTNSAVAATAAPYSTAAIQVVGTYTGVLTVQVSIDGTNWISLGGATAMLNIATSAPSATIASATQGIFQLDIGGFDYIRVVALAAVTGSATVNIRLVDQTSVVGIDSPVVLSGTSVVDTELPAAAALADAAANPTTPTAASDQMLFNNVTWDRYRNNYILNLDTSAAKTASGNGATGTNYNHAGARFVVNVTAVSGTSPTLLARLQYSYDGTNFLDYDTTNLQTVSITATGQYVLDLYPGIATTANASRNGVLPRTFRLAWTIGGTTPSFTLATYVHYIL